jgi:hypothetical protein
MKKFLLTLTLLATSIGALATNPDASDRNGNTASEGSCLTAENHSASNEMCAVHPARAMYCCKICTTGKACGNSCISQDKQCHQPPGCACDGN